MREIPSDRQCPMIYINSESIILSFLISMLHFLLLFFPFVFIRSSIFSYNFLPIRFFFERRKFDFMAAVSHGDGKELMGGRMDMTE